MFIIFMYVIFLTLGGCHVECYDSVFGKDNLGICHNLHNNTKQSPDVIQPLDFKCRHPKPIGILTTSAGAPVEIRDTFTLNTDSLKNTFHLDVLSHFVNERIPDRVVHAKGNGAAGYFEVTNDVSKYTKADVFNKIGKKTPVFVRMSAAPENNGGSDLVRGQKGMAVKFYTKEGNLDLLCLNIAVFPFKDPIFFAPFSRVFKRNPKSNLMQSGWDFVTLEPQVLNGVLWAISDRGQPKTYRHMDGFPIHTYELNNKKGEKYFVRFNFRTNQGVENITSTEAQRIQGMDMDFFTRDLYNNIALKNYPSWKLEIDILSENDLKRIDYDPFDVTRLWKKGTYITVPIGNLILNKNPINFFKETEQSAFNPSNLVPGIPGPIDEVFKARRLGYLEAQIHRLGVNHNKIEINLPKYEKTYNRDGVPPVIENGKDSPNYYPNSYNGPQSVVDESRPKVRLVPFITNAVDLQPAADFYNKFLTNDGERQRLVDAIVQQLLISPPPVPERAIKLLTLTEPDLGMRVAVGLEAAKQAAQATAKPPLSSTQEIISNIKKQYADTMKEKQDDADEY